MDNSQIQILGLTPEHEYAEFSHKCNCKEMCETDKLGIPHPKPDMKDMIEVFVSVSIKNFKTICTAQGKKLVIDGIKHVKILYTADKTCQNVHSAHFDIPFCEFILLRDPCEIVVCVKTVIEHISVHQLSCRDFTISIIMMLCPVFKEHRHDNPCEDKDYESAFREKHHRNFNEDDHCENDKEHPHRKCEHQDGYKTMEKHRHRDFFLPDDCDMDDDNNHFNHNRYRSDFDENCPNRYHDMDSRYNDYRYGHFVPRENNFDIDDEVIYNYQNSKKGRNKKSKNSRKRGNHPESIGNKNFYNNKGTYSGRTSTSFYYYDNETDDN